MTGTLLGVFALSPGPVAGPGWRSELSASLPFFSKGPSLLLMPLPPHPFPLPSLTCNHRKPGLVLLMRLSNILCEATVLSALGIERMIRCDLSFEELTVQQLLGPGETPAS